MSVSVGKCWVVSQRKIPSQLVTGDLQLMDQSHVATCPLAVSYMLLKAGEVRAAVVKGVNRF